MILWDFVCLNCLKEFEELLRTGDPNPICCGEECSRLIGGANKYSKDNYTSAASDVFKEKTARWYAEDHGKSEQLKGGKRVL